MKYHILYNPYAGNKSGKKAVDELKEILKGDELEPLDLTVLDMKDFIGKIPEDESVIVCGGDGTLNHLANAFDGDVPDRKIYYYPSGTGNDFANDIKDERLDNGLYEIRKYLINLPSVTVNGQEFLFLNGIGYGIDGYCCEVGDKQKAKSDKPVNYTSIAINGLLFHYKPTEATVVVDGKEHKYHKTWLCPTMKGRFYGGGMMMCPNQKRDNPDGKVTVAAIYGCGKVKTLTVFPTIFKGEHIKHTEMVDMISGKDITVTFNRPVALQVDGETVLGVTTYTVHA